MDKQEVSHDNEINRGDGEFIRQLAKHKQHLEVGQKHSSRKQWSPHFILIMYNRIKKFDYTTIYVCYLFINSIHTL